MAKFHNKIGYAIQVETTPGVWQEQITERAYSGDIIKNVSKMQGGENLNDDLNIDNRFSIVADPFAYENFSSMRYVYWMGAKWKVKSVEVQWPRIIFTIGGVYNEQTPGVT